MRIFASFRTEDDILLQSVLGILKFPRYKGYDISQKAVLSICFFRHRVQIYRTLCITIEVGRWLINSEWMNNMKIS
ncbi:hypothetical protein BBOV_I000145 [Babesia bovis T2Bo]|uniref:Uncharacterized protein n=1 Tax=Babesia bovis TaxID=5865 RepID=S6AZU7_BABBO|nr:hypothetical protein BBOV_I000145 [Babesia bovis T2Bo]KAG6440220.1 hypothetical protein BBOV_I000145 [Babesia bovis T2Bo]BAN64578.1 hypothetical protein [Babesia bovis]